MIEDEILNPQPIRSAGMLALKIFAMIFGSLLLAVAMILFYVWLISDSVDHDVNQMLEKQRIENKGRRR